jgi:hypothetical protein
MYCMVLVRIGFCKMSVLVCIDILNTGTIYVSAIEYIHNTDSQYRHNTDPIQRERIVMYWQLNTYQFKHTEPVIGHPCPAGTIPRQIARDPGLL